MSRVLNLLLLFGIGMSLLVLAVPLYLMWINIQPQRYADTGQRPVVPYETLQVVTSDGIPIVAWLLRGDTGAPCVVVIHGKGNTGGGMLHIASTINAAGFHVLLPDLRGHGASGEAKVSFGLNEVRDIEALMKVVRARPEIDHSRLGVLGQSMGSGVAIRSFASDPTVRGFVIDSGFGSLSDLLVDVGVSVYGVPRWISSLSRLSFWLLLGKSPDAVTPSREIEGSRVPMLFFHAKSDQTIPISQGRALFEAARGKKLFIETDGGHADCWGVGPEAYEIYTTEFFKRAFTKENFDPQELLACDTTPVARSNP